MNQHVLPKPEEIERALGMTRRSRMRRWLLRLFWLSVLGGAAAAGYVYYQPGAQAGAALVYETVAPTRRDIQIAVTASGRIEPVTQVDVATELGGIMREVLVKENDEVKVGDVLARLDTTKLLAQKAKAEAQRLAAEARVRTAQASLNEFKDEAERQGSLRRKGLSSEKLVEQTKADLIRAAANLDAAKADLQAGEADLNVINADIARATLLSPISGIVLSSKANTGQTVSATASQQVLFTLAQDLVRMEVAASIDEADIGQVKKGQNASFTVEAFRGESFPARIELLSFASEKVDGVVTYKAVLSADNPDLKLRPGMTAAVRIVVEDHKQVLAIANEALRYTPPRVEQQQGFSITSMFLPRFPRPERGKRNVAADGSRPIHVLRNGEAVELKIKTGASDGKFTILTDSQIKETDQVIVSARPAGR